MERFHMQHHVQVHGCSSPLSPLSSLSPLAIFHKSPWNRNLWQSFTTHHNLPQFLSPPSTISLNLSQSLSQHFSAPAQSLTRLHNSLSISQFLFPSLSLSVSPSLSLYFPVSLCVSLCLCLPPCLSASLCVCVSLSLSLFRCPLCLSLSLYLRLCLSVSFYLSPSLSHSVSWPLCVSASLLVSTFLPLCLSAFPSLCPFASTSLRFPASAPLSLSLSPLFSFFLRKWDRYIFPNHTPESYPESYLRIIPQDKHAEKDSLFWDIPTWSPLNVRRCFVKCTLQSMETNGWKERNCPSSNLWGLTF